MKRRLILGAAAALLLASAAPSCGDAPSVVQGAVVSYDPSSGIVVLSDERAAGRTVALDLTGAEKGSDPAPGDTVRIAYRATDLRALRVMNVSRRFR
ncbi:MAG TPA: hypothetical protein PKW75_10165 [candidate division Zixibacteria bacterium]|nr:hypothetical protein [candidate division Zixibacteria bacterium]MDD4917583.1 hypothetical protein [candidate division Zixibacteria bacterium]MDM7971506.1 hypothetical protein [candidate division Zixibacteria bacterium]HOD67123.1 hypothetical protein [candidate division Zixibacteria bacterium]HOZ08638.1 hypothetical protein [candidate division Zixibacteria bacterium]